MNRRLSLIAVLITSLLSLVGIPGLTGAQIKSADFDANGKVDFGDFFLFVDAFGSRTPADLSKFDLSNNGAVDFDDFFLFAADFGKITQRPASKEAQWIALCISGELRPPQSLAYDVEAHLAQIRTRFGNLDATIASLSFEPPWLPSCVIVGVDTTTFRLIREGSYHAWDALNLEYNVTRIRRDPFDTPTPYVVLYFEGIVHPRRLVKLYASLPGVRYAEPNGRIGDSPNIYPKLTRSGLTYLFRDAWGDCPAGCTGNKYWYFTVNSNGPLLIGVWNPQDQPTIPAWWDNAKGNMDQYRGW